jgi:putative ABC transport system ATP-binding protein
MGNIELRDLKKHYGRDSRIVHAIDGVNLNIQDGEFVSIVGRSGSGKTTLLDCLGLLLRPTSGEIFIDEVAMSSLTENARAGFRSKRIGFIFQSFNLLPSFNAIDNVLLPLRYSGGDKKTAKARAHELLEEVGLSDRLLHRPTELSGGEQQRVAIARALVNQPALVLCDEPTGEVDSETSATLVALMRRMNREQGVTFVIVTHDQEVASQADRMVSLKDGLVISDDLKSQR